MIGTTYKGKDIEGPILGLIFIAVFIGCVVG